MTLVTYEDAQAFLEWLSKKDGKEYRLPTESEWEYACRAGTKTAFHFGDAPTKFAEYDWFAGNASKLAKSETWGAQPVATKKPNAWGLYDMHGNVKQWCGDWYGPYPTTAVTDPKGPETGTQASFAEAIGALC